MHVNCKTQNWICPPPPKKNETNDHKSDTSGKMSSVTEKSCLLWIPARNLEYSLQNFKIYTHMCIKEKVEDTVFSVQTTKANGRVETEAWLLNKDKSSIKYLTNEGIIATFYPLHSSLHWKPHTAPCKPSKSRSMKSFCEHTFSNFAVFSIRLT